MSRRFAIAALACFLATTSAPAIACFFGPKATPGTLSLAIDLPERVSPSVVIRRGPYTFYIPTQVMDSMMRDQDLSVLLPAELIDTYRELAPLELDAPVFEWPESDQALSYMLAYAIDRSAVAVSVDGMPVESVTRTQYDNGCEGGRNYRYRGSALIEVVDWQS